MGEYIRSDLNLYSNNFRIQSLSIRLQFCLFDKRELLVECVGIISAAQKDGTAVAQVRTIRSFFSILTALLALLFFCQNTTE